jgi:hypothetical protein
MRRRRSGLVCFLVLAFCVFFVSAGQSLFAQARDASPEPSIFPLKTTGQVPRYNPNSYKVHALGTNRVGSDRHV